MKKIHAESMGEMEKELSQKEKDDLNSRIIKASKNDPGHTKTLSQDS